MPPPVAPAGRRAGDPLTRFQKLAALTLATTILLVIVGVIVRATDSGLGCPDWPLCHGQIIPPLDDPKAWIEWIHRDLAVIIGFQILGLAFLAIRDHRDRPSHPVAVPRGRRPRRLPGVARARDGPPREQRGVGHGPPGRRDDAGRAAGLPARSGPAIRHASAAVARASDSRCWRPSGRRRPSRCSSSAPT